ncbi:MAG TPA: hypothetical protein VG795_08380, partial [Acidimicrobiia bacterium]|nr:hypothetical protein [Acidimicrobiia bacterium]
MRPKAVGLLLLLTLTGTACAGEVGRYRNAAVSRDGVTILAAGAPVPAGAGETAGSVVAATSDAAGTGTTAATGATTAMTEGPLAATPSGSAPSVTVTSGPAARLSRPSSATSAASPATAGQAPGATAAAGAAGGVGGGASG